MLPPDKFGVAGVTRGQRILREGRALPGGARRIAISAVAVLFSVGSALCGMWSSPASAAAKPAPEFVRQFITTVRENFSAWNAGHDGSLTKVEIEIAMQNPAYRGDAGAALAALKWALQPALDDKVVKPPKPPITLADLDAYEQFTQGGANADVATFRDAAIRFKRARMVLAGASRSLFAGPTPHLAAIKQGWDSDCYFNSGVGAVAFSSPQTIVRLIAANPDGSYTVTFPNKPALKVSPPTDAEIAAYTDADGIWFNVLEKAWASIRKLDPNRTTAEPLDTATLTGGSEGQIVQLLSGHAVQGTRLRGPKGAPLDPAGVQRVRDDLAAAFREHRAVVTSKYHHAFAIVDFDPRTDTITIHNPYDANGYEPLPSGDLQLSSGGYFALSTQKFVDNFNNIGIELARPAKP